MRFDVSGHPNKIISAYYCLIFLKFLIRPLCIYQSIHQSIDHSKSDEHFQRNCGHPSNFFLHT